MIRKQGIKLWADGSRWVGTAALSYPYLDSATVRCAGIPVGPAGESAMNYSRSARCRLGVHRLARTVSESSCRQDIVGMGDDRDAERR